MKRLLRIGLAACLLIVALSARAAPAADCPPAAGDPSAEQIEQARRNARDHGFLWRISKDGRNSWLYGTIHVARLDWIVPGPTVMQAVRDADTVALELDLLDPAVQAEMADSMAGQRRAALPPPLSKRVRRQVAAACVPYATLAKLTPEMQIMTLTLLAGRRDGLDAAFGTDVILAGMGHGARKNVVSLETPAAQLKVLHMRDAREARTFVEGALADLESGRVQRMLTRFAGIWAAADYDGMAHYQDWCECLKTPVERDTLKRALDDRNPGLAASIDALHADGKQVFAAVGSLHMFGPLGLPELMAQRGYQVERIDLAGR